MDLDVLLLCTYRNRRHLDLILKRSNFNAFKYYFVSDFYSDVFLPFDKKNLPYFFVIDHNLVLSKFLCITTENTILLEGYLNTFL